MFRKLPDGMVSEYSDGRSAGSSIRKDQRLEILQPFLDCCMTVLPDTRLTTRARTGLFLFMLGAADRLWARMNLDPARFPAFAAALLQQRGLGADEALTLAFTLPGVREEEAARECLLEGAEALDAWLDSHDGNCVLRLGELIIGWQQA